MEVEEHRNRGAGGTVRLPASRLPAPPSAIGRYRVLSELGRGAMARVYLALDPNIDRKIALKVLEPRGPVAGEELEELRQRFLLEARAAGSLRHPSAVAIYDADHDPRSGHSYIAMEWVDGQSLDRMVSRGRSLPIEQAVAIARDVASALDTAHGQGLIHRDVKPANILLDGQGRAKISDFGIVKCETLDLTITGQVLGTPYYMSPEQIRSEPIDGRSDLFSLGVVLYQCLTGDLPFRGDSLPSLTHKIVNAEPRPPRFLNERIPENLDSAVRRALAKDPAERFQSGVEFARAVSGEAAIESAEAASSMRSPTGTLSLETSEQDHRGRRRGILGVALAVAVLLALIPGIWQADDSTPLEDALSPVPATTSSPSPPAVDGTTGAAAVVDRAAPRTRAANPAAAESATLEISFVNRLKKGTLEVWVDGDQVLTRSLRGPKGVVKRTVGRSVWAQVPIAPGHHDVKVRVRGSSGKLEASNWTGNSFSEGQTRRLRVDFIPPRYLRLAWK